MPYFIRSWSFWWPRLLSGLNRLSIFSLPRSKCTSTVPKLKVIAAFIMYTSNYVKAASVEGQEPDTGKEFAQVGKQISEENLAMVAGS